MSKRRGGFTLIELLMVIVIVSILAGLLTVAGMSVVGQSREAATKTTLRIAQKIIDDRLLSVMHVLEKSTNSDPIAQFDARFSGEISAIQNSQSLTNAEKADFIQRVNNVWHPASLRLSSYRTQPKRLQKIVTMLEWQRIVFPQTWAEADYQRCVKRLPAVTNINPLTENSEVFLFMLTQGTSESVVSVAEDADAITPSMKKDTDGNGEMELVDSWGTPIRLYRWPTRLLRPLGLPADYKPRSTAMQTVNVPQLNQEEAKIDRVILGNTDLTPVDPNDSLGELINHNISDAAIDSLNTTSEVQAFEQAWYLPATPHYPVVVSAGPDAKHGMLNPVSRSDFGYWGKIGEVADLYDDLSERAGTGK